MSPRVSVIIPHRNRLALLQACLAGLAAQRYRSFEVIVVDNASTDGSLEWLQQQPGLLLRALGSNRGFTGANLAGLELAQGSFIAALNNDTVPEPDWLANAVQALERDPQIGTVASCILKHRQPHLIDAAGDGFNRAGRGVKLGNGEAPEQHARSGFVFGACAAAALYRRSMLDEIGFFDDRFYFNCEDVDLSARAQLAGWSCWYEASARVLHQVSASHAELGSLRAIHYWSRNNELLWFKNIPLPLWPLLLPPKILQELLTLLRNAHQGGFIWALLSGKAAALARLPGLWAERQRIQSLRRVSVAHFYRLMVPSFDGRSIRARLRRLRERPIAT